MFEKLEEEIEVKADEYALEESTACDYGDASKHVYRGYFYGFKKGAEFGFNKANEWHDLRKNPNDLPPKELEEKQLLIRVRGYEDFIIAYYMLDKYYSKNGKRFFSDIDCDFPIDTEDIIDWKEIIPPETKGEKK